MQLARLGECVSWSAESGVEAEDEEEEEEGRGRMPGAAAAAAAAARAPGSGGCQAVPHQLCTEPAGHRRAGASLHHLLCHRQRGVLHPALLDRRRRGHPASWLFRALPLTASATALPS